MTQNSTHTSTIVSRWGLVSLIAIFLCIPVCAEASYFVDEDYYYEEEEESLYFGYESNVQAAFAEQNPTSSGSGMGGRRNVDWSGDGYDDDEEQHPGDPLPLGDGTLFLLLAAAIMAGTVFLKRKQQLTTQTQNNNNNNNMTSTKQTYQSFLQKLFVLLVCCCVAGQAFAWKPIMIGHRGCCMGVENTEEAFLNAIKVYGFQALECDVKMTKDLVPVCWHDDVITTSFGIAANCTIAQKTLAEVQALTLTQTRSSVKYTGGKICTLDRYMEICCDYNVIPVVELKYTTGITSSDMSNFSKIYQVIQKYGMEDRTIILGFESGLKYVRTNYPRLKCQHLVNSITTANTDMALTNGWDISSRYYSAYSSEAGYTYVTQAEVQLVKNYGRNLSLWTINNATTYKTLASYGANYVTSDDLKLKDIADLSGTDPNVTYSGKTIYYRPSTTNFAKGYTNLTTEGKAGGWSNVYWGKNSRMSLSVHGPYKANIYLDYEDTKDMTQLATSRFIKMEVPNNYTGVIAYRLKASDATNDNYATKDNYITWMYGSAGTGITNSNTVPKFTNTAQIPTPEPIPTDGRNLLCNREGWWDVWYWAYYLPKTNTVTMYFANTSDWTDVKLVTGKDIYTHETDPTTKVITGTKLAYFALNGKEFGYEKYGFSGNGTKWDNSKTIPVVGGAESNWVYDESSSHDNNKTPDAKNSNANQNRIANRITYATSRTGLLEHLLAGTNLYTPGDTDAKPTHNPISSWEDINHTQTFVAETGGKVACESSYKLTGANTSSKVTTSATEGTSSVSAAYTATTTVTATANTGYTFAGWYEGATKVSNDLTYSYLTPNSTKTLTAKFIKGTVKDVRAQAFLYNSTEDKWEWKDSNDGGTFTMTHSGGTVYTHTNVGYVKNITVSLDPVTFEATPNSGYSFIGWWNNPTVYTNNPWTLENPANYQQSVTARFATLYKQTITANEGGTVTATYNNGQAGLGNTNTTTGPAAKAEIYTLPNEPVTIDATPATGYNFLGWYEGATLRSLSPVYTYNAKPDYAITAVFEKEAVVTPGNYRLRYVEQTATSKTDIAEDYSFASVDEIPLAAAGTKTETIVSLHIYNKWIKNGSEIFNGINNPEVILQQHDGTKWVDVECHMVFGPLQIKNNGGNIIKLPGSKRAGDGSSIDDFVYDTGIAVIKNDTKDHGCGVWNFVVVQDGGKAYIDIDRTHRYTGDYYIRTMSADGGYDDYTKNLVSYSEYAYTNYGTTHDFTHYFYNTLPKDGNVKFTIANEYSSKLAHDLLIANNRFLDDDYNNDLFVNNTGGQPTLPELAQVRFSWDIITNRLTRAYIAETKPSLNNDYLIATKGTGTMTIGNKYFFDNTNGLFSIDLTSAPDATATVTTKYNNITTTLWNNKAFVNGAATPGDHPVRVLYDFKHHRFVTIYIPSGTLSGNVDIKTPVMILRKHNDPATQLTFNTNYTVQANGDTGEDEYTDPAYAVLTFLEDKFATGVTTTSHYEKMFYWVSFPFDVNLKDVFGLGAYGDYWAVEYYNGPKRAMYGLPTEESTGWDYLADDAADAETKVLKANTGYVVCLNYRRLCKDYGYVPGGGREVSLYFPSAQRVTPEQIQYQANVKVHLPALTSANTSWNHHNWHLVGIPSFATPGVTHNQENVRFVYEYWHPTDGYAPKAATEVGWYPMHSYIMQYAGDITWSNIMNITPSSIAARREAATETQPTLCLELQQAGNHADQTYVQLSEEGASLGFDLNQDLTKLVNKGANIYSVVNGDQMAGNVILKTDNTLPLGVIITAAGEYTFAMPNGTEGMVVELIDYDTRARVNLLLDNYTVNLPAGTFNSRFALSIRPDKTATSVENIDGGAKGDKAVRKFLIDGKLYIQQGNLLFDAQGKVLNYK